MSETAPTRTEIRTIVREELHKALNVDKVVQHAHLLDGSRTGVSISKALTNASVVHHKTDVFVREGADAADMARNILIEAKNKGKL